MASCEDLECRVHGGTGAGRKAEARPLLAGLPPESLTLAEVELIKTAVAD